MGGGLARFAALVVTITYDSALKFCRVARDPKACSPRWRDFPTLWVLSVDSSRARMPAVPMREATLCSDTWDCTSVLSAATVGR